MTGEMYAQPIAPKRCPECGGVMVWGNLQANIRSMMLGWPDAFKYVDDFIVERADMRGAPLPIVVNICTVCGHIGLYATRPQ